jgi:SAM-dependent methyltransferase
VPRILPDDLAGTLPGRFPRFFDEHPELRPRASSAARQGTLDTADAFGDEWQRFPELLDVHRQIFEWYFEGPQDVQWEGLRALDAGCGMGRWLHFAAERGARAVGVDASAAIDVAAARDGHRADFVQADLRRPPFAPGAFDLVYSLGVVHHLEQPVEGVRVLSSLVRPAGELRLYVYRSLRAEPALRRALLAAVTALRRVTTRLPYPVLHAFCWLVADVATLAFLLPRRLLRRWPWGDRLTRGLPLVQYTDVPFRMLVAEQFDRFAAPIEFRYTQDDVAGWIDAIGFERVAVLAGLGWRAIARRR